MIKNRAYVIGYLHISATIKLQSETKFYNHSFTWNEQQQIFALSDIGKYDPRHSSAKFSNNNHSSGKRVIEKEKARQRKEIYRAFPFPLSPTSEKRYQRRR